MTDSTRSQLSSGFYPVLDLLGRPDDLSEAMEEFVVGADLLRLVRELEVFHGSSNAPCEMAEEMRNRIMIRGLSGLAEDELRTLLNRPRVLLGLQQAVLTEGGDYWDEVIQRAQGGPSLASAPTQVVASPPLRYRPWYRSPGAWAANALTATAAALAVCIVFYGLLGGHTEREHELRKQIADAESIRHELAALRSTHPPITPSDLPEAERVVLIGTRKEPVDLPENDPDDLPDPPQMRRSDV